MDRTARTPTKAVPPTKRVDAPRAAMARSRIGMDNCFSIVPEIAAGDLLFKGRVEEDFAAGMLRTGGPVPNCKLAFLARRATRNGSTIAVLPKPN